MKPLTTIFLQDKGRMICSTGHLSTMYRQLYYHPGSYIHHSQENDRDWPWLQPGLQLQSSTLKGEGIKGFLAKTC